MGIYVTPFKALVVDTSIYASGDALGSPVTFTNIPEHGVLHGAIVIDRDKEQVNLDINLFTAAIATTALNGAFAPSNAELATIAASILVSTWRAYSANALGVAQNVGAPYWAPSGSLVAQCVTRGTPTYTATTDVLIALLIVI